MRTTLRLSQDPDMAAKGCRRRELGIPLRSSFGRVEGSASRRGDRLGERANRQDRRVMVPTPSASRLVESPRGFGRFCHGRGGNRLSTDTEWVEKKIRGPFNHQECRNLFTRNSPWATCLLFAQIGRASC